MKRTPLVNHRYIKKIRGGLLMALIPFEPFQNLDQWKSGLDKFFNDAKSGFGYFSEFNMTRIDVFENEKEVVAHCEIPGLEKKEDVHIHIDDNLLTIHGVINRSSENAENQMHRKERFSGRFQRSITLPSLVNAEGTTATYRNGVLEVRMPKTIKDSHKPIDIQFQ
jgi:HSP20 family protein